MNLGGFGEFSEFFELQATKTKKSFFDRAIYVCEIFLKTIFIRDI